MNKKNKRRKLSEATKIIISPSDIIKDVADILEDTLSDASAHLSDYVNNVDITTEKEFQSTINDYKDKLNSEVRKKLYNHINAIDDEVEDSLNKTLEEGVAGVDVDGDLERIFKTYKNDVTLTGKQFLMRIDKYYKDKHDLTNKISSDRAGIKKFLNTLFNAGIEYPAVFDLITLQNDLKK